MGELVYSVLIVTLSIREKTAAENIVKEIKQYQGKWLQHVQRMDRNRLPKQAL
jgi:lipocalin